LRLIGNVNPWTAKDAGLAWQKVAAQIHEETKDVREKNSRGKVMNCQVIANGPALNVWYTRQAEKMNGAYSNSKEKATSGQTGMRKKAIEAAAKKDGEKPENVEKEWDVLRHLQDLRDEAGLARKTEKSRSAALKSMKDDKMPKEILKLACDSKPVCLEAIKLCHKRKREWEREVATLKTADRHPVASEAHKENMQLLKQLQQQIKEYSDYDEGEDEDYVQEATSSDAKGGGKKDRGLKTSFGMLTAAVQEVTAAMQADDNVAQAAFQTLTTEQLKANLLQLDADIHDGLPLEPGERALVREWQLKRYAQGLGHRTQAAP
jgi:hypothetical protein